MRILILSLTAIALLITGLIVYNHVDVQAAGDAIAFDPSVPVLRTPEARFEALTDFPFAPNYVEIEDSELGVLRVHYLDEGPADAPVILLLHGQATWSYSYRDMIPPLVAAGYRVVVPDMIGFGRSDKPADWNVHTFDKHIDWLAASLQAIGIRNSTGYLFDWGGYFGLPLAVREPDIFARLVLNTTTVPRANSAFSGAWVAGWRRYALKQDEFPISKMVSDMTTRELDADTLRGLDAPYPDESYKGGPRRMPMMIPATYLNPAALPNQQVWDALAGWNKPTLTQISRSLAERAFDPQELHDQIPGTAGQPHLVLPDAGFFLIEDDPEALTENLLAFIDQS